MHMLHINYSSCPSNLLCPRIFKHHKKKKGERAKKKKERERKIQHLSVNNLQISPDRALHVSCKHSDKDRNPSATSITAQHRKLLSLVNWNYFSLLTSVLAFHLVRKLNLRSSSLLVFLSLKMKDTRWIHKQVWTHGTQKDEFLVLWCSKLYFFSSSPS